MDMITWEYIWGVVLTTVVGGLIRVVGAFIKEQKNKHEEEERTKNDIFNQLVQNNKELLEWRESMEIENKLLKTELQAISKQITKITDSDLIILKDRILQSCRFFIGKGSITMAARENIADMYACYKDMGGNGTCKIVFEEAMKLEISDIGRVDNPDNYGHDHLGDERSVHHVREDKEKHQHSI